MLETKQNFPVAEPFALEWVKEKKVFLEECMGTALIELPIFANESSDVSSINIIGDIAHGGGGGVIVDGVELTTKNVRFEESTIASFLLSLVKKGLQKEHEIDLVMLQAGEWSKVECVFLFSVFFSLFCTLHDDDDVCVSFLEYIATLSCLYLYLYFTLFL